jgi:hypothetical protein
MATETETTIIVIKDDGEIETSLYPVKKIPDHITDPFHCELEPNKLYYSTFIRTSTEWLLLRWNNNTSQFTIEESTPTEIKVKKSSLYGSPLTNYMFGGRRKTRRHRSHRRKSRSGRKH